MKNSFRLIAKAFFGMEEILAQELKELGAKDVEILQRAVSFTSDMEMLYKANYCCRNALSILKPFAEFEAENDKELYQKASQIKWEHLIDVDCTMLIETTINSPFFTHSLYAAQKTKDAIADRFRRMFNRRPSVDIENPDYRINLHIYENKVTLSLNSSGEPLYKRGYRIDINRAPMNEVLAAGLIKLTEWKCDCHFFDPMCGSGTLLIEAGMLANKIPAQYYRKSFGFQKWHEYKSADWRKVKEEANKQIEEFDYLIWGSDIDRRSIEIAEANIKFAKLHKDIDLFHAPMERQLPPEGKCLIITNPPYGERIQPDDLNKLYESIGNTFKHLYGKDKTAWLISSNFEALKHIGLKPSKKITVYNGSLECRFSKYELYEGSKKQKPQNEE